MRVHQEGVSGWNDRAGVSVDINSMCHAPKRDINTVPEVSSHGGSLSVAPGRDGCLYIDPLNHSLSILCLRGRTQWKSCSVLTFEVHVSELTSASIKKTSRLTTGLSVCVNSIEVFCLFLV